MRSSICSRCNEGLACRASASIPPTAGAAGEVPSKPRMQADWREPVNEEKGHQGIPKTTVCRQIVSCCCVLRVIQVGG